MTMIDTPQSHTLDESSARMMGTSDESASSSSGGGGDRRHNTKKRGLYLRWSRLTKTVQIKESNAGLLRGSIAAPTAQDIQRFKAAAATTTVATQPQKKTILNQVSGCAQPGQVLCMMGPSGSGKTSLLNALSGRTTYDAGSITIDGSSQALSSNTALKKRLMAQIAYVKQADIFFTHLTVRDQLGYTAFLRLPQEWSKARKLKEVEDILQMLRLTKVADSKISSLSGGEKKRVNIGTELLTDPSCLLLDEPTSGLDSTSAVALMRMLQTLARTQQKTVITSIHQPNSALFFSFDQLLLLAEGNVVYFGSPRDSLAYLKRFHLACPDGYNAADHWMDLLVYDTAIEDEITTSTSQDHTTQIRTQPIHESDEKSPSVVVSIKITARDQLIEAWDNEAIADQMDLASTESIGNPEDNNPSIDALGGMAGLSVNKYNTSWGYQYRTLVHRSLKNSRSAIFTPINLIKSAAIGVVSGALWYQIEYTEANVFDLSSFFFFTMTYWVFDSMFMALMSFPLERGVILKERSSASYHLGAYFMAKSTSEMPTRLILPLIYMVIAFWMAGISDRVDVFAFTTLVSLLSVVAGEAIGLMVGASIYDMEKAMTTMTVISLALMLLGGFFVENVPSWLEWGKFLSPFKYSFDASRLLIFDEDIPCDGSGALEILCGGSNEGLVSADDVTEFLGVQGTVGFNVGMLLLLGLVPRYLAYLALRAKKEEER